MPTPASTIDTSIVVCTCSRVDLLRRAVDSLLAQTWAHDHAVELVLLDDGSTDSTPAYLAEFALRAPLPVRIVQGPRQGIAAARNTAFAAARGRWLASFDDDQLAHPDWLRALRECADAQEVLVVGGALTLLLPPHTQPDTLGPRSRAVLGEHIPFPAACRYTGNLQPATNNALLHRDLFVQSGGFDLRFTEGGEDKELFRRLAAAGHALWFEPAARAEHITPLGRLQPANLRWTSLRLGASDARFHRLGNRALALRFAALRALAVPLRDLPRLLFRRPSQRLDTLCSLWYTEGLLRAGIALCQPGQEHKDRFLHSLNFRQRNGERPEFSASAEGA